MKHVAAKDIHRLIRALESIEERALPSSVAEKITKLQTLLQQEDEDQDTMVTNEEMATLICDPEIAPYLPEWACSTSTAGDQRPTTVSN